jgi:DNA-binding CsgD family transcriptional regulator
MRQLSILSESRQRAKHRERFDDYTYEAMLQPPSTPEDDLLEHERWQIVERLMLRLTPREEFVYRCKLGFGCDRPLSLEAIASKMSITRERVRQILNKAERKLRLWVAQTLDPERVRAELDRRIAAQRDYEERYKHTTYETTAYVRGALDQYVHDEAYWLAQAAAAARDEERDRERRVADDARAEVLRNATDMYTISRQIYFNSIGTPDEGEKYSAYVSAIYYLRQRETEYRRLHP